MSESALAAVLAGGAGRRMRADKAAVDVAGTPMLDHVLAACTAARLDAIVVGRPEGIPDRRRPHSGPLAGIEAALMAADGRPIVAVAVDHPWVRPETLRRLADASSTTVPAHDDRLQVTCARYEHTCLEAARVVLDEGPAPVRAMLAVIAYERLDEMAWRSWGEDGRSWFSADTPEAVTLGLERFGDPAAGRLAE